MGTPTSKAQVAMSFDTWVERGRPDYNDFNSVKPDVTPDMVAGWIFSLIEMVKPKLKYLVGFKDVREIVLERQWHVASRLFDDPPAVRALDLSEISQANLLLGKDGGLIEVLPDPASGTLRFNQLGREGVAQRLEQKALDGLLVMAAIVAKIRRSVEAHREHVQHLESVEQDANGFLARASLLW